MERLLVAVISNSEIKPKEIKNIFEEMLEEKIQVQYFNKNVSYFYTNYEDIYLIKSSFNILREDFDFEFSILISHSLSPIVEYFFKNINLLSKNNFEYLYEAILKNKNKLDVLIPLIREEFKNVNQISLESIDSYIDNNLNVLKTSSFLGIHRNTLNYRLETFFNETNLDVRIFINAMYFKIFKTL